MKKIIFITGLFCCSLVMYGQQTTDYILKARALTGSGNPGKAISILKQVITGAGDSRLFIEKASAEIVSGDYSSAINDLNEANKLSPSSGEYGLSRIYALKGDASTALYHLELNLNSGYKKAERDIMLDQAFSSIDNKPEWRQFWKKERYSTVEKGISEIEYYLSAGKTDDSKEVLAQLKSNYNGSSDILYAESLINLATGKYSETIKTLSGLVSSDSLNPKYLKVLAKAQTGASDPAGASDTYTRMLNYGVDDAELLMLRADCYVKTGETDKAMKDVRKYLEYYPENREALSLAGKIEVKSGDNLKAIQYYSENLKVHPNDPQCYVDRANSYFVAHSWDLAVSDYSMSLDLKPSDSDAWLNKGIALLSKGDVDDACHDFRQAFRLGNKRVAEYLSKNCIK